jgi:hypothetical protein
MTAAVSTDAARAALAVELRDVAAGARAHAVQVPHALGVIGLAAGELLELEVADHTVALAVIAADLALFGLAAELRHVGGFSEPVTAAEVLEWCAALLAGGVL